MRGYAHLTRGIARAAAGPRLHPRPRGAVRTYARPSTHSEECHRLACPTTCRLTYAPLFFIISSSQRGTSLLLFMSFCHENNQGSIKDKFHLPHGLTCPYLVAEYGTAGCPGVITVGNERVERFSDYGEEPRGCGCAITVRRIAWGLRGDIMVRNRVVWRFSLRGMKGM